MRNIFCSALMCCAVTGFAAVPSSITYQGALKNKNGTPASGTYTASFEILETEGGTVTSHAIDTNVPIQVRNGLFAVFLHPGTLDLVNLKNPSLRITINNERLDPPEPINATAYAIVSSTAVSVVDGSISKTKLDSGVQDHLMPSGAILMFDTGCPQGWSSYAALNKGGLFPRGANAPGPAGGSSSHSHTISIDGGHRHNVPQVEDTGGGDPRAGWQLNPNPTGWSPFFPGELTDREGEHNHGGATAEASSIPPYLPLVFCQKQ